MAGGLNKVMLIGNLGKDPEIRKLNNGKAVASFSIATSESWRDKQTGERQEKTEWHNIVVYNENIAKVVEQYCKKGSKVYVEGKMKTRVWEDQGGQKRYSTEVVIENFGGQLTLLSGTRERGDGDEPGQDYAAASGSSGAKKPKEDFDDDIPF